MRASRSRAGFTVLEVMLALALLSVVAFKSVTIIKSALDSSGEQTVDLIVEDHARRVLRKIAKAVMQSDRQSIDPATLSPQSSSDVQYRVNLGVQGGTVLWSNPELIGLEDTDMNVFWSQNPETAEEFRVVWTNLVAPYLEGEIPNGMDDNGNGLIDEKGLSFVVNKNAVTIRLTLERIVDGRTVTKTVETTVTCRNLGSDS